MTPLSKETILEALQSVQDPDLNKNIVELGFVKDLAVCDGSIRFTLELTTPACPVKEQLKEQAQQAVLALEGAESVNINMTAQVRTTLPEGNQLGGEVRNVIAITSGKGGVGKTTCAVNIAAALAADGAKVGILDADVYGPNVPVMLGLKGHPEGDGSGRIVPLNAHGIKAMSVGFLVEDGQPVMWRGPMLHKALEKFLREVDWGELDYLLVDMPPGTGDAQISLAQLVPMTGAVVVTLPQEVSLVDVRRAIGMCEKVRVDVLGVVENMAGEIFGEGGGARTASDFSVPFLGSIPMEANMREGGDAGIPSVTKDPNSPSSKAFQMIARQLAAEVSKLPAQSLPTLEV
ncbi:MAG TPA: sodium:proton antiporter [Planctomycetes bacterium]|nr:sodium:proton antiporter [Planctomycetota bacterium]